jgi:hypothetical protein
MDPFLVWLESTAFSVWVREATTVLAFPTILALHTIGMGFVVGVNVAVDLRILGVGVRIPIEEMRRFMPAMWAGFWLNAASGVALLIGYPTKALTNPVFYLKLGLIAAAMLTMTLIGQRLFGPGRFVSGQSGSAEQPLMPRATRTLAAASLLCWTGAITAGRLLAYTYRHLMAGT